MKIPKHIAGSLKNGSHKHFCPIHESWSECSAGVGCPLSLSICYRPHDRHLLETYIERMRKSHRKEILDTERECNARHVDMYSVCPLENAPTDAIEDKLKMKLSGHHERMENIARTLLRELGEDDPYAEICLHRKGQPDIRLCYQPNLKRVLEALSIDHEALALSERETIERPLLHLIDGLRRENLALTQQKAKFFAESERFRTLLKDVQSQFETQVMLADTRLNTIFELQTVISEGK